MAVKVKAWKGAWWLQINHKGRRKSKRVGSGKEGKKAADLAAVQIQAKLAQGDLSVLASEGTATVPTFAAYAEECVRSMEATRLRGSSADDYRLRLRVRLLPQLGHLRLTDITRDRARRALVAIAEQGNQRTAKSRPLARTTLKVTLNVLHAILGRAVEDGWLPKNPAAGLSREIAGQRATEAVEIEVFSPEDLGTLLVAAEREEPEWHPLIMTLARAGLRIGEAIALEWRDVDFGRRLLIIRRTRSGGRENAPKNGKGRRVDMSRQLAATLQGLKSLQEAEAVLAGTPAPGRCFSTSQGKPINEDAFRNNVWSRLLRRAGLRYRKPHALRHTFASLLIEAGEPLKYVQEQLGHHSPAFTLAVYGHLLPRGDRRAVDRLDDATFRNPGATDLSTIRQEATVSA